MSRNKKVTIETATPVVNIETVATPEIQAEAPKALVVVNTERKPLVVITGTGAKATAEEAIPESVMMDLAALHLNTVNSVKTLFATGFTRKQIVAAGFNSSTVYRQVGEYIKAEEAKKLLEVTPEVATVTEMEPAI